jgi:hypothetical protein
MLRTNQNHGMEFLPWIEENWCLCFLLFFIVLGL